MGNEVITATIGGAVAGVIGGVISGSVGSGIMQAANHTGYNVVESVEMGAVGGAIFLGGAGLALASVGFFNSRGAHAGGLTAFVLNSLISGLIGYAILHEATPVVAMELRETAIAFAVGAVVFGGAAGVAAFFAFCCGMICCASCLLRSQAEADSSDNFQIVESRRVPLYGAMQMPDMSSFSIR